jgi:hypothetical protein
MGCTREHFSSDAEGSDAADLILDAGIGRRPR